MDRKLTAEGQVRGLDVCRKGVLIDRVAGVKPAEEPVWINSKQTRETMKPDDELF